MHSYGKCSRKKNMCKVHCLSYRVAPIRFLHRRAYFKDLIVFSKVLFLLMINGTQVYWISEDQDLKSVNFSQVGNKLMKQILGNWVSTYKDGEIVKGCGTLKSIHLITLVHVPFGGYFLFYTYIWLGQRSPMLCLCCGNQPLHNCGDAPHLPKGKLIWQLRRKKVSWQCFWGLLWWCLAFPLQSYHPKHCFYVGVTW